MTSIWTRQSRTSLGIIPERITGTIPLPINATFNLISVTRISGNLPPGLRLEGRFIVGTPFEVVRTTVFTFVLRAVYGSNQFEDRTFSITVEGADQPQWLTQPGLLPIGPNFSLFILDTSPVNLQLEAFDTDLAAGDILEFYVKPGNGELPPGLQLTIDGRLVGIVEPLLALDAAAGDGGYDTNKYGGYPFDYGLTLEEAGSRTPRKLNRYYEFIVTVTDGETEVDRKFIAYIVGDDFLKADNTQMSSSTGIFTADNTFVRTPIWLTPADLGYKRANNYVTLFLDILDSPYLVGNVVYTLETLNDDNSLSTLPPGMFLDSVTGEIAGRVPYQPAVTKEYKFTVKATRYTNDLDVLGINGTFYEDTLLGRSSFKIYKLLDTPGDGIDDLQELVGRVIALGNFSYKVIAVNTSNTDYDVIFLDRTLNPEISIVLASGASIGDDTFYINRLTQAQKEKLKERYLNFTSTESHQILSIVPYIDYEIKSISGSGIEINFNTAGVSQPVPGESIEDQIKRVFASSAGDTYVTVTNPNLITISTPFNSNSARSRVELLFVSPDSTEGDIRVTTLTNSRDLVTLDTMLIRNIANGTNIGIALFQNESFERKVTVSNQDEVVTPSSIKTFTVNVLGEVDSTITWNTAPDLGTISANFQSTFAVSATTTVPNARLIYTLVSGRLPPGLSLLFDGEIVGKVRQFGDGLLPGLTIFDNGTTTFDLAEETTIDREYVFTVAARDRFGFSATQRTFTITVLDPNDLLYSNIYMKPMLKEAQRLAFTNLINDPNLFPPQLIYRPNDPDFGLQKEIKMLAYAGIETKNIEDYVRATVKYHRRRRYKLGSLKKAEAKIAGTNNVIYEVIYIEVVDPAGPKKGRTRKQIYSKNIMGITVDSQSYSIDAGTQPFKFRPVNENTITADTSGLFLTSKNISNITNMRGELREVGITEREFLPLWMRTAQEGGVAELGYTLAIPLCFCKPGGADQILLNLQNENFDFKTIDLEIDRYIIDSTTGLSQEQYILFANYNYIV
jgi:hypothetical protein